MSDRRETLVLGMGCFWGAQKRMAALPGVLETEVGYAGGSFPDPTYDAVLDFEQRLLRGSVSGRNHAEVVKVVYDPELLLPEAVLAWFWENHDPTQLDRQGNDFGSNYRSAIYTTTPEQREAALATRDAYQRALSAAGYGPIVTEIAPLVSYTPAEEYHQHYLLKHPNGYCGLGGTGVRMPHSFWRTLAERHLPPLARWIACEQGTERPFTGPHLDERRPGVYVDRLSNAPLFRSEAKFESPCGWPSFHEAIPGAVTLHEDRSHGMIRTEVRSASTGIHLGHVFDDGPPPTGLRYCINGEVLRFIPDVHP